MFFVFVYTADTTQSRFSIFLQFCLVRKVKCLIIESGQKWHIFRRIFYKRCIAGLLKRLIFVVNPEF